MEQVCIVHYDRKPWYSALKNITEISETKIRKAKIEHDAKLERGDHAQCQTVSDQISHEHHSSNPCYKQFARILADNKKEELSQRRSSVSLSTGSSITSETASLFKDKCYLCQRGRAQSKHKERFPVTRDTDEAVETLQQQLKAKDAMYQEVQQLDLNAKEFKRHEHCHYNFTRNEENASSIVAFF